MELDVLVVGAGPAGAAVSILPTRQGYRVLLVDRAAFPRDKACAEYLSPACTPLLAQLGVLDAILTTAPQRLQGMRVIDHQGRSCWGRFSQDGQRLSGQGIYLALHSATLAAAVAHRALCGGVLSADALRSYFLAHRQTFRAKYRLSTLIQLGLRVPWLAHHIIDRLACRPTLADIVVGVAGAFLSPKTVLSWRFAAPVFL
jgi:hypothetical protein